MCVHTNSLCSKWEGLVQPADFFVKPIQKVKLRLNLEDEVKDTQKHT